MFLLFYVTHPDEKTAQSITQNLLEKKLIACANIFPIQSSYWWMGAVQNDKETVSILKTSLALGEVVMNEIQKIHPYEVPSIIRMQVSANIAYQAWIDNQVIIDNG
jgi:periplasmic divalent cation tolerance protein